MLNLEKIGSKITELRKANNMKQNELADKLYVTHQAVSKWENGKSIPQIEILYDLTQLFNVSIDYLLNDSEIREDDYETLLSTYPREAVISKALQNQDIKNEVDKFFYLLKKEERKTIIDQIINKKLAIPLETLWHSLSERERWYILNIILSKKFKFDLSIIFHLLSDLEQQLVLKHYKTGTYEFKLPRRKGVIL